MLLKKILKGNNLEMPPQWYAIMKNLLTRDYLWVFKISCKEGKKNMTKYKLVM